MANTTKNSIYLSESLQAYFDEQCELFGMGKSAFMAMVLTQYKQQQMAMSEMSKMSAYMDKFEKIVSDGQLKLEK